MTMVADITDRVTRMMDELRLAGSYDVVVDGQRNTGWVGKPGGADVEVSLTIKPLHRN